MYVAKIPSSEALDYETNAAAVLSNPGANLTAPGSVNGVEHSLSHVSKTNNNSNLAESVNYNNTENQNLNTDNDTAKPQGITVDVDTVKISNVLHVGSTTTNDEDV